MLIYNVTTKVDWSVADSWLKWMQEIHIQEVLNSGCFIQYQLMRLLDIDEADGPTYAAQYYAPSRSSYDEYIENHAAVLQSRAAGKWNDKVISFRTLMEVVPPNSTS